MKKSQNTIILAIHGFTGQAQDFSPLFESGILDADWRFVDLPGHHRSGCMTVPIQDDWDLFMSRIDEVVQEAVDHQRRIVCIAYSMGARLLLRAQLDNCWEFEKIILIGATAGIDDDELQKERFENDQKWASMLVDQGIEKFIDEWIQQPIIKTQRDYMTEERLAEKKMLNAKGLAESMLYFSNGKCESVWDEVASITNPVYLVAGACDEKFLALHERMKIQLPHASTYQIPLAGHAPHIENPEAFLAFFKSLIQ